MIDVKMYVRDFKLNFPDYITLAPWEVTDKLECILSEQIKTLSSDYIIDKNIAIHNTAIIESGVVLKGTIIISENCVISANAYLRGPIFLGQSVKVGPCSEIKQSIIMGDTALAHFNYIGNSIIGKSVNFEAGSICANHYNERHIKNIIITHNDILIDSKTEKFGSLVGDDSKIGANAVLSPGSVLSPRSVVRRLELIDQTK